MTYNPYDIPTGKLLEEMRSNAGKKATIHLGDCSTGCDICARLCSGEGHDACIGTLDQRSRGDALARSEGPEADATNHPYVMGGAL